jgi:RNA polymerase sigma-70 factor (ECF subfamily)
MSAEAPTELSAIYARELDFVWRSVRRLGVPTRDLPDVTHDVFVTVIRNLWKFDASRELRPWLFGVAMRVVSDYKRRASHHRETLDFPAGVPADLPGGGPDPHDSAERGEEARVIDRALATIGLPHRAVLIMHDFEGYDGAEIAKALTIHPKTVYSRLRAARQRFVAAAAAELRHREDRRSAPVTPELLEEPLQALLDRGVRRVGGLAGLAAGAFGGT